MDKHQLLALLGPLPQHVPLDLVIRDAVDCGTYLRSVAEYSVEPGERVSAFVLTPKDLTAPAPAIFCYHQHAGQFDLGKSEVVGLKGDPQQAIGSELAAHGYVVIAPDAIGFEERNWTFPTGHASYHELTSRLVRGQTLLAKVLHDVSRAIDVLESLPEVDPQRIGFVGHSYGGRMAMWAPALDRRITASVSNCGCISYQRSLVREAGVQMEFCLPGMLQYGDIADVARLIAPRALRIQATTDDKWSAGAQELFDAIAPAFPAGSLELEIWPGGHVFSEKMREAAYRFLDCRLR